MSAIRTKLGKGGRVIIPATFRQNLHLEAGDDIIFSNSKYDLHWLEQRDLKKAFS